MTMHPLVGHHAERQRVLKAIKANRLPQLILLTGPAGVGKQRFGLWLAQAVLCRSDDEERPCGQCVSCRQVLGLVHPDLHWVMPVTRPKAQETDKQVEELAEAVGEVVAARRADSRYRPVEGLTWHYVATSRLLQRQAALTPAVGNRKLFLVAEADRLVPQDANPEAANALLKLLEEPPADSVFVLTVEDPSRLLPTIRSRVVPLRLGRLPDQEVEAFLAEQAGLSGADLKARVASARGSIGRALGLGEEQAKAGRAADDLLKTVASGPGPAAERVLKQGTWAARGDFTAMLDALAETLSEAARSAADPAGRAADRPRNLEALVQAQSRVAEAREAAQGNVNPQLLLAVLTDELAEVL